MRACVTGPGPVSSTNRGAEPVRVLLTRPHADSEPLAAEMRARGDQVTIEPMLRIVPRGSLPPLDGVVAIVATSANGIRAFAAASDRRDLPVYAVGDATARAARESGFAAVDSAKGDAAALGALIAARLTPGAGALLHVRGRDVAGNLDSLLASKGFTVLPAVLYKAEPAGALSAAARETIAARKIDIILFFSPRTARTFVRLAEDAGLADRCRTITAICLSSAVAQACSGLSWRRVQIAAIPDRAAMMRLCDALR